MGSVGRPCPAIDFTAASLSTFEEADAKFPGKHFAFADVDALDGSDCRASTLDGVLKGVRPPSLSPLFLIARHANPRNVRGLPLACR
jgi:hypothetical protein